MSKDESFASFFEASLESGKSPARRRLRRGDVITGTVIQIGAESVFLDVGATTDARIDRGQLEDDKGKLSVQVGDSLTATVIDMSEDTPLLSTGVGRGSEVNLDQLKAALEAGTPVVGKVSRAVKGGLEVDVGGMRGFCPASQVEVGYAADLASYEGQELEFRVIEIKDARSVVLSRRALLEEQRRVEALAALEKLTVGSDVQGEVRTLTQHGAVVDLGGLDGFVHISELAHRRVEKPEDVVSVGDRVEVRVLSIEQSERGPRVRLSMKARLAAPEGPKAGSEEVLAASVTGHVKGGLLVHTEQGDGLVPVRELGLAPGADPRRAYPTGSELSVVLLDRGSGGRLRFSVAGVARVQERKNFREFSGGRTPSGSLGSLGDLLRDKLGLEAPAPEPAPAPSTAPAAATPSPAHSPAPVAAKPSAAHSPAPAAKDGPRSAPPPGVVRRKR